MAPPAVDLERYVGGAPIPWQALEVYLAHATPDDLHLPEDDEEAAELADAIVALDWLRPGPQECL
jgi:hypothetical protein